MENKDLTADEKKNILTEFVPENTIVSPMQYITLVSEQIMGRDKGGNLRSGGDLKLFLYQCKRTGLDPISKQIYAIFRWSGTLQKEVMTIQTGIDGYRAIAERTGLFGGSDDPIFEEKDGKLIKATCTVYKINRITGERMAITASARWDEYAQWTTDKTTKQKILMGKWAEMPYLMLGKCAEALALRKAFPSDLSGIYTDVEVMNADKPLPEPKKVKTDNKEIKTAIKSITNKLNKEPICQENKDLQV
jgi:phage recombination protein Bet